jgi:hypothetical protein
MDWKAEVRFPPGTGILLLSTLPRRLWAHPTSYPLLPGVLSPRTKRPGRDTEHSLPTSGQVTNDGAIPPLPDTSS